MSEQTISYTEDNIRSLDWKEHIRLRPGMYIGKLGDGSSKDDGIYVLVKEVVDNCIDEHMMGYGRTIDVTINESRVSVRDYGRGIPLGKVVDVVSKINTGGKYDSDAFKKSIGLNGVGTKAVNALSISFKVTAFRDGQAKTAEFSKGELVKEHRLTSAPGEKNGTLVEFRPDDTIFKKYHFVHEYIDRMIWNYAFLNTGLKLYLNGVEYKSDNGLKDLLEKNITGEILYPIIHLRGEDIELAMTHSNEHFSEEYYSYVNGQFTTQGGTHQGAFREAIVEDRSMLERAAAIAISDQFTDRVAQLEERLEATVKELDRS